MRKKIIGLIVSICVIVLLIDGGYVLYQMFFKPSSKHYFDSINSYVKTKDGYVAVGSNNDNDNAYEKAKITKYDDIDSKVWEKIYNRGYNSIFHAVAATEDGYVAVGSYQKTKQEKKDNTATALFVKYNEDGEEEFVKTLQILGDSRFKNVAVVDDGYIVVGQSIYENSTLGNSNEGGAIIVKYDKSGKVVWQDNYGGNKSGLYNDVLVDGEAIYVVGKNYGYEGLIVKYSLNGEREKVVTYESTDSLGFTSIIKVSDDFVVVGGKKVNEEDKYDHDTAGLVVKYNKDLEKGAEISYQGKGIERFNKAIKDKNNNIVLVGHSGVLDKKSSTKVANAYRYHGLFAKYKENLKEVFVVDYEMEGDSYFTDLQMLGNKYLISGYSQYKEEGFFSKFITYSSSGKILEVK